VSGTEAVNALQRLGFFVDRQRGSHVVLKKVTPLLRARGWECAHARRRISFERLRPSAKATLDKRKRNDGYQILDLEIDGGELLDDCREHFVDAKFDFQVRPFARKKVIRFIEFKIWFQATVFYSFPRLRW
jgi:hypothetical protein